MSWHEPLTVVELRLAMVQLNPATFGRLSVIPTLLAALSPLSVTVML